MKAEGDLFIELEDFNKAIKVFKALKNLCRKWQAEAQPGLAGTGVESTSMVGTGMFYEHIMSLYSQIGYLYAQCQMYKAAADYFKKQLVLAWQQNDLSNETRAYESLSLCYYYMDQDPANISVSMRYNERVSRGLIEEDDSKLRRTWIAIQN